MVFKQSLAANIYIYIIYIYIEEEKKRKRERTLAEKKICLLQLT